MPMSGRVARRVKRPRTSSTGMLSSVVAASVAAISGGSSGTRYSSRNSTTVVCQLAILVSPECQNTDATLMRNRSCSRLKGKRSRRARSRLICSRQSDEAAVMLWALMLSSAEQIAFKADRDDGPVQEKRRQGASEIEIGILGERRVGGGAERDSRPERRPEGEARLIETTVGDLAAGPPHFERRAAGIERDRLFRGLAGLVGGPDAIDRKGRAQIRDRGLQTEDDMLRLVLGHGGQRGG